MSTIKIISRGKRHRIIANFADDELSGDVSEKLRIAGAKVRCESDGTSAEFCVNIADVAQTKKMLALLLAFGEDGDFTAGKKIMLEPKSESDAAIDRQQRKIAETLDAWQNDLPNFVGDCLRQKFSRVETLRRIRRQFGDIAESAVRSEVEEQLRRRYESLIFCQTFMRRLGWDTLAENSNASPEPAAQTGVA